MGGPEVFQRRPYKRSQNKKIKWIVSAPALAQIAEKGNIPAQVEHQKTQADPAQSRWLAAIIDQGDGDPAQPAKIKCNSRKKAVQCGAMERLIFDREKQGYKSYPGKKIHVPAGKDK